MSGPFITSSAMFNQVGTLSYAVYGGTATANHLGPFGAWSGTQNPGPVPVGFAPAVTYSLNNAYSDATQKLILMDAKVAALQKEVWKLKKQLAKKELEEVQINNTLAHTKRVIDL